MNGSSDANWFSLEQSAKEGNIIPIVGPDALMVEYKAKIIPFYQLVTKVLLRSFQVKLDPEILQHTWSLHKAVTAILAQKSRDMEKPIYKKIFQLVAAYSKRVKPAESLRSLASIPSFTLYVSLTPDDLLERAMSASNPALTIRSVTFWPRDASESLADLPLPQQGERRIFKMLGSCTSTRSGFAMHEEDVLESLYRLQTDPARRFTSILSELRRHSKLFINCNFPDWLGRAILRLVNDDRLYVIKDTQEFLCPNANDVGFCAFLNQYSPNTMGFEGKVDDLIQQLARSLEAVPSPPKPSVTPRKTSSGHGPTVFVSYASQNADVVRSIANTLLDLGFSDVWLDKKKLISGDDWSNRIKEAIGECDFFIPVLSREADARREAVFWEEWAMALERARRIKDAFLLPIGIDSEFPDKKDYRRIFDGDTAVFLSKNLIHAPQGMLKPESRIELMERCRRFEEESHG